MPASRTPEVTKDPDARRSFAHGENCFRAYLAGGSVRFLEEAKNNFDAALRRDDRFHLARLYLGITLTQLRDSDDSIPMLQKLRESGVEFDGQVGLQLAYAHLKRYEDEDFRAAERELEAVANMSLEREQLDPHLQAQAMRVFLYAVMAGRMKDKIQRPHYAQLAVRLGDALLKDIPKSGENTANAALFDIFNGLGIAWMRIGQFGWPGFPNQEDSFQKSESYYQRALSVRPNAAPVLQNLGQLRDIQSKASTDSAHGERVLKLRREAWDFFKRSIEINDQDRFPFYSLAKIVVDDRRRADALDLIEIARTKPGAVKEEELDEVRQSALRLPEATDAKR